MIPSDLNAKAHVEITVAEVAGSAPRPAGTRMYWFPDARSHGQGQGKGEIQGRSQGTIGGGNLEYRALDEARRLWDSEDDRTALLELTLGPELGQCCGGRVKLLLVKHAPAYSLIICGAGHVGTAVAETLIDTSIDVCVVDTREEWADARRFADSIEVVCDEPEALVRARASGGAKTFVLVMTHDHRLDERLCRLALQSGCAWIGLIGSQTKWSRFRRRLIGSGMAGEQVDRIVCPVGDLKTGHTPKEIAIGIARQLLVEVAGSAQDRPSRSRADVSASLSAEFQAGPHAGPRAGLILAGGASSRMGRWKGGLEIEGVPLVQAHARALAACGAELIKIVYPDVDRQEAELAIEPGHRVLNANPEAPLFASLCLGLGALLRENPELSSVMVTPVDAIPLEADWLSLMWDKHEAGDLWATRPYVTDGDGERRGGHPVILDQRLLGLLLASDADQTRLDRVLRELGPSKIAELEYPTAKAMANLNRPEDWEQAQL